MKNCLFIIALFFLMASCKQEVNLNEARQNMLSSISQKLIIPSFEQLESDAEALQKTLEELKQNNNAETLQKAQDSWKALATTWQSAKIYNFGAYKETYISSWVQGNMVNKKALERKISLATDAIDEKYVDNSGANVKGLYAAEYLLFDEAMIQKLKNSPKHLDYLLGLSQNLVSLSKKSAKIWQENQQNFVTSTAMDVDGSTGQLINSLIFLIQKTYQNDLAKAVREDGTVKLEEFYANYSEYSKELMLAELTTIEANFENGLYQYIELLNVDKSLNNRIQTRLKELKATLKSLDQSLEKTASTNAKDLEPLKTQLRDTFTLFKVDLANQLGIVLTFNDNDGD